MAARPDEPLTPEWTAHRARTEQQENAAIDQTFTRARRRESNNSQFLEEELQLAAEDDLEKIRAGLKAKLDQDMERMRLATADQIANLRLQSLRASALETPAAAARRKADIAKKIQDARDRLATSGAELTAKMRKELAAAEQERREQIEKKVRQAREEQRAPPLPEEDAQRRLLREDFAAPSPRRLEEPSRASPPVKVEPHALTANEPALTLRKQAPVRKPPIDLSLVKRWSTDETKSLIRQWAKLYGYDLVSFEQTGVAVDRTDACLAWLRAGVWKKT